MPTPFILAIDQGTTSSRAMIFDPNGRTKSIAQKEFPQYYPKPGWVEHNPADLWNSTKEVCLLAMKEAQLEKGSIAGIGITNQRETTLLWERATGRPVAPAIVWQDRRTAQDCARLKKTGVERKVRTTTGLLLDPYFSGTKLAWMLNNLPGIRRRAEKGELAFGTVDTWLLWQLTGGAVHATDPSNASRTLLCNLKTGDWDDGMLKLLKIPREVLPEVRPSSGSFGEVSGVPELDGVPILGIAGDQQAALMGQACLKPGMAKNTYGTGCFMLLHTGEKPVVSKNKLLTTIAWRLGKNEPLEYALEGSVFIGGAVVQWLRDGLGCIQKSSEVEALAAKVTGSDGVVFVPAFTGLGAPHWDPTARGAIFGMTRGTTTAHIARAAVESIGFQCADLLGAMESDAGIRLRELRVDGGAANNEALMQWQSDLLRVPVVRPTLTETTALGAAFLAGLAAGVWPNRKALEKHWTEAKRVRPLLKPSAIEGRRKDWNRAVERCLHWAE